MEFRCSFLRRHFTGKLVVASQNVGCFVRLNHWKSLCYWLFHTLKKSVFIRDGPLENLWGKNYSCCGLKKIHTRNLITIKITDSKKDSSEPSRISVVSSAYWLNLKSMPLISMPLILCFFRMASASISADRINRYGDKGQPCLTPRLSLKKLLAHPLFRIQLSILQ